MNRNNQSFIRSLFLKGLVLGSKKDHWCKSCNVRSEIQIPTVRFNQLQPSGGKQHYLSFLINLSQRETLERRHLDVVVASRRRDNVQTTLLQRPCTFWEIYSVHS